MKWLVTWESEMDTNDADYVKDNGDYGIVDDTNRNDMLKLLNTIISCDVYAENFDDGSCQLDDEEQIEKVYERLKTFGVTDEELDKMAGDEDFCVDPSDYKPSDPNGWSVAHDLYVNFFKVPADAPSPDSCADSWFKKIIKEGKVMNISGIFGLSDNASVTINGKTYTGRNITINGNKVSVDGSVVEEAVSIYINVTGNVEKINTTGDIEVHGNVGSVETGAGDIDIIGDVSGDVETGAGDIVIKGNVAGDVETGAGSIHHGR